MKINRFQIQKEFHSKLFEERKELDSLLYNLKRICNRTLAFVPPPADLVVELVKEILLYATIFFSKEQLDKRGVNPSLKIEQLYLYTRDKDGFVRVQDTGQTVSRKIYKTKPQKFCNERISDVFYDFYEFITKIQNNLTNSKKVLKAINSLMRPKSQNLQPLKSNSVIIRKQRSQIFYLKRKLKKFSNNRRKSHNRS